MDTQTDTTDKPVTPGGSTTGNDVKKQMGAGAANLMIVNAYALALGQLDLKAPTDPPPPWFNDLSKNLDTAKGHAKNWLGIATEIGSAIPTTVIEYSSEFRAAAGLIETAISTVMTQKLKPGTPDYKTQIDQITLYLNALRTKLASIDKTIEGVTQQLNQAQTDAKSDFKAFSSGVGSIQKAEVQLQKLIGEINVEIGVLKDKIKVENDAFTASILGLALGIFILVAGIAMAIATGGAGAAVLAAVGGGVLTLGGIGGVAATEILMKQQSAKIIEKTADLKDDKRQIAVLKGLDMTIDTLMENSTNAQQAMVAIRTQWKTIDNTLDDIIKNVNATMTDPDSKPLDVVLDPLAIATAANEWQALENMVTSFREKIPKTTTKLIRPDLSDAA